MRKLFFYAFLAIVTACSSIALAATAGSDPVLGIWQLNSSKSTFTGVPAIKSQTRTYSQSGLGITLVMKSVGADGKETTSQTTYELNGKEYPVTGVPDYDTISAQQVDSHNAKFTFKKAGKVVGNGTRAVSKDGKTLTSRIKVTTTKGEQSDSVLVFDKQ